MDAFGPLSQNAARCLRLGPWIHGTTHTNLCRADFFAGDLNMTEEDMNLLYSKYERNGGFNYYAFCKVRGSGFRVGF